MKKYLFPEHFAAFYFYVVSVLFITSCSKEEHFIETNISIEVESAKVWFENNNLRHNITSISNEEFCNSLYFVENKRPDWGKARSYKSNEKNIVEVPIIYEKQFDIHQVGFEKNKYNKFYDNIKLVIIENENGYKESLIMTIIPDNDFLEKNKFKPNQNFYKKMEEGYNGIVVFHTWAGDFKYGEYYKNGEIIGDVTNELLCAENL